MKSYNVDEYHALAFMQRVPQCLLQTYPTVVSFLFLQGNDLHFNTETQASLPDSLKAKPIITFRITELDGETKQTLM